MSVATIDSWRVAGCGRLCLPHRHSPSDHEQYGRLLERASRRHTLVRTGPLTIDLTAEIVTLDGVELPLSRREYDVLACLARTPGCWRPRRDILTAVWGSNHYAEGVVCAAVWRLRARLGPAGAALVETSRNGRGERRLRVVEPVP